MDIIMMAVKLLGGLAMFLYGMEIMGDGLKQGSGTALKNVLGKLTHNVVLGVLTGALVTAVIQSSTATIVLTVGLIGAGILNLRQAVSIVMGANIGTTVTAQIIRLMDIESGSGSILAFFKPDFLAPVALIIGIILIMFLKKESLKNIELNSIPGKLKWTFTLMKDDARSLEKDDISISCNDWYYSCVDDIIVFWSPKFEWIPYIFIDEVRKNKTNWALVGNDGKIDNENNHFVLNISVDDFKKNVLSDFQEYCTNNATIPELKHADIPQVVEDIIKEFK